jgi:hypothetical protein
MDTNDRDDMSLASNLNKCNQRASAARLPFSTLTGDHMAASEPVVIDIYYC